MCWRHSWDAAIAQARWEARGICGGRHSWDAAAAQGRRETRWGGRKEHAAGLKRRQEFRHRGGRKNVLEAQLGCSHRASAMGSLWGRVAARSRVARAMGRFRRVGTVVFEPLGRSPSGCSRAAPFGVRAARGPLPFGRFAPFVRGTEPGALLPSIAVSNRGRGGMQPSRKRDGKPVGRQRGNRAREGCSRRPRAAGNLLGRAAGNPMGRAKGTRGWVKAPPRSPRPRRAGNRVEGIVGMQPSRKREGKPAGLARACENGNSP
jgi:hypothetical protein